MIENFFKDIKFDTEFFKNAAKHVIDWNAKARGGEQPEFTQELFMSQIGFVREELKEYETAAKVNDHVELLDAAADIFVVSSYLTYMFFGEEHTMNFLDYAVGDVFTPTVYTDFDALEQTFTESVQMALMAAGIMRMSRDTLIRSKYPEKKVIKEVLKSNDSKYPTKQQLLKTWKTSDIDSAIAQECAAIEERNANRPEGAYTGVHAVYNEKQKVYVFFDDKGKIMKPSTFVKPNIAGIINK
ncbi:hypothetical protein [Escherichia phage PNJ1809-36]|uniref:Phosphoribosyl-ATP pyrophosphohydrolase n=1 Tax=Escherichia phage PNJ1809-36 TaxID=2761708 RepID=A0A7S9XDK6_9CAUD|nr:hypothetical protein [Escherichia phage PNJ1809-36]